MAILSSGYARSIRTGLPAEPHPVLLARQGQAGSRRWSESHESRGRSRRGRSPPSAPRAPRASLAAVDPALDGAVQRTDAPPRGCTPCAAGGRRAPCRGLRGASTRRRRPTPERRVTDGMPSRVVRSASNSSRRSMPYGRPSRRHPALQVGHDLDPVGLQAHLPDSPTGRRPCSAEPWLPPPAGQQHRLSTALLPRPGGARRPHRRSDAPRSTPHCRNRFRDLLRRSRPARQTPGAG